MDAGFYRNLISSKVNAEAVPDVLAVSSVQSASSGLRSLDLALGIGGWARGRINYIAGPQHSGKTALALLEVAVEQQRDAEAVCAIIDIEHAYSESLAQVLGVDTSPDRFLVIRPETAEEACKVAMYLMGYECDAKGRVWKQVRKGCSVIIYDSWAGSPTEEVGMATLARVGAEWWPKLSMTVGRSNTLFFCINQIREKPGVMFGNPEYEPGGRALEHARSIQVQVHKVGEVEKDGAGVRIGHDIKVYIAKNKLAPPFKTAYVHLNYYSGFDLLADAKSTLDLLKVSLKETEGGNILVFESGDVKVRANGEKAFLDEIRFDPEAAEAFLSYVDQQIAATQSVA